MSPMLAMLAESPAELGYVCSFFASGIVFKCIKEHGWACASLSQVGFMRRDPFFLPGTYIEIGIGSLTGTPLAGALLTSSFIWWRPIVFCGVSIVIYSKMINF